MHEAERLPDETNILSKLILKEKTVWKNFFLKYVHPSWTSLFLRAASQGTLQISLLNRLNSALWKSSVEDFLMPLLVSLYTESYYFMVTAPPAPNTTSPTSPSVFANSRSKRAPALLSWLTSCDKLSSRHSKNIPDCLFAVLSSQQIPGRLKSHTRIRVGDLQTSSSCL